MSEEKGKPEEKKTLLIPTEAEKKAESRVLMFCFIALLLCGLGNSIFNKLQTYPMYNYPFFLSMFTTAAYIPVSFAYIIPVMMFGGDTINAESRAIPKYQFGVMGTLDACSGFLGVFAVAYITNAPMIVMLGQAGVPVSMLISKLFLSARYSPSQYFGAAVVMVGLAVVLTPSFMGNHAGEPAPEHNQLLWSAVYVLSVIPSCLSSVYKEKAMGEVDIDVIYLNGWVALFQFAVLFPLSIPSSYASNLTPAQVIPNLRDGLLCLTGVNSITPESIAAGVHPPGSHLDDCQTAPYFVSTYLVFNIGYNVAMICILKYGSAALMYIALTLMVPLANIAFALPFVPNPHAFAGTDIAGLLLIMGGLFIYRFAPRLIELIRRSGKATSSITDDGFDGFSPGTQRSGRVQALNWRNPEMVAPMMAALAKRRRARLQLQPKTPSQLRSQLYTKLGLGTPSASPAYGRGAPGSARAGGGGGSGQPWGPRDRGALGVGGARTPQSGGGAARTPQEQLGGRRHGSTTYGSTLDP